MSYPSHQTKMLPLLARFMTPFKRALGFSFDTGAFLSDTVYARIILQQALACEDEGLRSKALELTALLPVDFADSTVQPKAEQIIQSAQPPKAEPKKPRIDDPIAAKAEQLRADILRKYKGGAR